jgi:peroxiredoxin
VVAVFWSAHCEYCARHNVHIEKLHRAVVGKALTVLGICRDASARDTARLAAERGYTFAMTVDAAPLAAALATRRITPLTITVGRDGRLRQVIPGQMLEDDVFELLFRLAA